MRDSQTEKSTRSEMLAKCIPWKTLIFLAACLVFGFRLGSEPHFVDESAYIAQSFYADLFLSGRVNDPAWLEYGGYDLPPLPKYLTGISLRIGGFPRPTPSTAFAWYDNTSRQFVSPEAFTMARVPDVLIGAMGCVVIYVLGRAAFGRVAGLIAATLLVCSPLYWLHARRAMSDVPAEAFMLASLMFGLLAWRAVISKGVTWKNMLLLSLGSGGFVGLAVLSKLNGTIAGMILAGWLVLSWLVPFVSMRGKVALTIAIGAAGAWAVGLFILLNPFVTTQPSGSIRPDLEGLARMGLLDRLGVVKDHRLSAGKNAMKQFPHDALPTIVDKVEAVAVQGYGRFSPLGPRHSDSRRRFDLAQDWGAIVWGPLVLAGGFLAFRRGRLEMSRKQPPVAWAILIAAAISLVAVTAMIPLAWDRYFISIQPWSVLLASAALAAPLARFVRLGDELT